jgi:hypothetical protein
MKNRIQVFIFEPIKKKFLLLRNNNTITKIINETDNVIEIIFDEIKNKIGMITEEIFSLNWGSVYLVDGKEFKEMNYFASVKLRDEVIDEDYQWVDINEFIEKIVWKENKELLKRVLIGATKKEIFFDKKERGE